jgi:hypothetical protein
LPFCHLVTFPASFFFKKIAGQWLSHYKSIKQFIFSYFTHHCFVFPGFEPGTSVPQANAMTTAPGMHFFSSVQTFVISRLKSDS